MKTSRRGFLSMLGASAAGLAFLPHVKADPAAAAPAKRVLVLNQVGGIRSSAAFHASTLERYNPYGLIQGTGTPFALGSILDDTRPDSAYTLSAAWQGAKLPRLKEMANQFSVLGTWSLVRGDHQRSRIEEPTGSATGADPGLLTRIAAGLAAKAGHDLDVPAFHLETATLWGNAQGAMSRYAPVALASHQSLPTAGAIDTVAAARTGHRFLGTETMQSRFDRTADTRTGRGKIVAETFALHKRAAHTIGTRLSKADMAVGTDDTGTLGTVQLASGPVPLTNAMLREAMLACTLTDEQRDIAIDAALAIRMLQLGSPAVVLEVADFDFHSGERSEGPALYAFFGRLWATLHWLLARIADPSGTGTLLDTTFVTTASDFSRDGVDGGWNGGEGTDHGVDASCFYLAHPVMGAGVTPGRIVGGVSTSTYDARREAIQIAPQQYLATVLAALGLDAADPQWGFPEAGRPVMELWS